MTATETGALTTKKLWESLDEDVRWQIYNAVEQGWYECHLSRFDSLLTHQKRALLRLGFMLRDVSDLGHKYIRVSWQPAKVVLSKPSFRHEED